MVLMAPQDKQIMWAVPYSLYALPPTGLQPKGGALCILSTNPNLLSVQKFRDTCLDENRK